MVKLNDYLYSGNTVLKILHTYSADLREDAKKTRERIDIIHSNFLLQIIEMLEHNDFLTAQSQQIREFYKFMAKEYPFLAFTFKGRIKSLIRAEEKFNGYIVEYVYDYYMKNGKYPTREELQERLNCFRDLIAYRIVISMPECHLKPTDDREQVELDYLYDIANHLPEFMEERGFTIVNSGMDEACDDRLKEELRPFYRDYIASNGSNGYRSLHITFFDNSARCYFEMQIRTKEMDDFAEIGAANHSGYEDKQREDRDRRSAIPEGECSFFDEAYERWHALQNLELKNIRVNMFGAVDNRLINDGCGLFRGRWILPYEHLSRFQNDLID